MNGFIKRSLGLVFVLALLLPLGAAAQSATDRDAILIISSYNPDARRMSTFIAEFERRIVTQGVPCDLYTETLECRGVADAPLWISQIDNLIRRYESRNLRSIVLLGQEAWASYMSNIYLPDGVTVYGCYASTNGVLLPAPFVLSNQWRPESVDYRAMAEQRGRIGGLLNHYDVRRNVEMILSLYPEVETLAFVSDNTYGGISLQALVRSEMKAYPELKLVLVDSRDGDSLVKATYAALPAKSAVLLGTWRVGSNGEYLMQRSLSDLTLTNPIVPVFSLTRTGIGDVAIGGCVPRYDNAAEIISNQILSFYKTGKSDHTNCVVMGNEYLFDSKKLQEWKIPEYNLPHGSIIEDTMAAKLSKYSYYIDLLALAVALLLVLLAFLVWLFLHTRKLKQTLEAREVELIEARHRAEESDVLKSAFLANMSHEIRTPLNAIVGFSGLLRSSDLSDEERSEYGALVVNNSEMLLTLFNDILDISSLECGKIKFNYGSEDIVQLCQHVIMTTAHTRQEGVEMRFECSEKSYMLLTDAHRLSQILINLLTNAGKFTSQGSITLAVDIHPEQRAVLFSVADTGTGIPLDKQELVFSRFEKLEGNKKKGTGLGLAICRQITMIFGGEIHVDSTYTTGARFVFLHPIRPMDNDEESPLENSSVVS